MSDMIDLSFDGYQWQEVITYEDEFEEEYFMQLVDQSTGEIKLIAHDCNMRNIVTKH